MAKAAPKKPVTKKVTKTQTQHDFLLLDRSGSMGSQWTEALSSINAYVNELAKKKETKDTKITVAAFDHQGALCFDVIRNGVPTTEWKNITDQDATPRGMTPLYDATVRLVALAEQQAPDNCVIVIMTDGIENTSRETTHALAKAALDRVRAKGWQVIFLGANFDNAAQAHGLGNAMGQTIQASAANLVGTMKMSASLRSVYASTNDAATMEFSAKQREDAKKDPKHSTK